VFIEGVKAGDLATWVSAVVTAATVVVAAMAIRGDNQRQNTAQRAEWARADAARTRRAAILAKTFHAELHRGIVEVRGLVRLLDVLDADSIAEFREALSVPLEKDYFTMMERFSPDLEGFSEGDAIAILNAVAVWRQIPFLTKGVDPRLPNMYLLARRTVFSGQCTEIIDVFRELQEALVPYFINIPGMEMITWEELQARNSRWGGAGSALHLS